MSSQDNNVNGVPVRLKLLHRRELVPCCLSDIRLLQACGNALFQNGVARQTFGFQGFVVSDCDSIGDDAFCTVATLSRFPS